MKLAIHNSVTGFHPRWIAFCEKNGILYKLVDCHSNDLIDQLKDCQALMWHFHQGNQRDNLIAKQIVYALSHVKFVIFPDFRTAWHFDDKVSQKYLLELAGAPLVPSHVFFDKKEAIHWANKTSFPKVFKLRIGSASENVHLIKTRTDCIRIIKTAFSKGFPKFNSLNNLNDRINKFSTRSISIFDLLKGFFRLVYHPDYSRLATREHGYVYFQDFIANNNYDTRIVVIGAKAFGLIRFNRNNDFRASGSGKFAYQKDLIDKRCVKLAFEVVKKLELQLAAFDFIFDHDGSPLIVEVSYGFVSHVYDPCEGYWDDNLNWYNGYTIKENWMVELVLRQCNNSIFRL